MDEFVLAHLADGDYQTLAVGVFMALAMAVFAAALWLRLFRWILGMFGLRA